MPRGKAKTKNSKIKVEAIKKVKNKKTEIELEKELEKTIDHLRIKEAKKEPTEINHNESLENDKRLIMWAGVIFFMAIILVLWVLNISTIFKNTTSKKGENGLNFDKITENYNKTLDELSQNLNKINSVSQNVQLNASGTVDMVKASGEKDQALDKEDISALKQKIEELEKKLNSTSTLPRLE